MRARVVSVAVAFALIGVPAPPASAQTATDAVQQAAGALRSDPVYVDPAADVEFDAGRVRERVRKGDAGPVFVAVLPASAGDVTGVARELSRAVGRDGGYAVIVGRSFAGGGTNISVRDLATDAVREKRSEGATAIVLDFIDKVAERRAGEGGSGSSSGGGGGSGSGSGDG